LVRKPAKVHVSSAVRNERIVDDTPMREPDETKFNKRRIEHDADFMSRFMLNADNADNNKCISMDIENSMDVIESLLEDTKTPSSTRKEIQLELSEIDRVRAAEVSPGNSTKKRRRDDDGVDFDVTRNYKSTRHSDGYNHYEASQYAFLNRPELPEEWQTKDIIFQHFVDEEFTGEQIKELGFTGTSSGKVPIYRLWGTTAQGHSVVCNVRGFTPYFYVNIPKGFNINESNLHNVKNVFSNALKRDNKVKKYHNADFVTGIEVVNYTDMYGYHQSTQYLKVYCSLQEYIRVLAKKLKWGVGVNGNFWKFQTYESTHPFSTRVASSTDIKSCAWMKLPAGKYHALGANLTTCQIEVDINYTHLVPLPLDGAEKFVEIAPVRSLSSDIECPGKNGQFPIPERDAVTQIANYVTVNGNVDSNGITVPTHKCVFTLGTCAPISNTSIFTYENEVDLLKGWSDYVKHVDPDFFTGYNTDDFDLPYLINRATHLGVKDFALLSRINNEPCKVGTDTFDSKAFGKSEKKNVPMRGRVMFDVLRVILKEYKLGSYTLNNVSSHFLGEQKEDAPYSAMEALQAGSDIDRQRLASYCLKDAYLPQRLMDKLLLMINYISMSRVTGVTIATLIYKGQQKKVISLILQNLKEDGYIMPDLDKIEAPDGVAYEGATVLEPHRGYYEDPIATLDFSSLYPSIMIAHNLCYTTRITKEQAMKMDPRDYTHTPPSPKYNFEGAYFVKAHIRQGILPRILRRILEARNQAKKDMGVAFGTPLYFVYNGKQLALKVTANSVYGFTGAIKGMLAMLDISASVTSFGRVMLENTKKETETKYSKSNGYEHDAKTRYGDSVTGDTPILCKLPCGDMGYYSIDELTDNKWQVYQQDKEEAATFVPDLLVWTERGFTKINRVIRHKTTKQLYRVLTHAGCVDVTEDHSLLDPLANKIKPSEVGIGTELLHCDLPTVTSPTDTINVEEAFTMGFFWADGSCGTYGKGSKIKRSWAINNQNLDFLNHAKDILERVYDREFKILDTIESSGVYKLVPTVHIKDIVEKYRVLFYDSRRQKRIPNEILNASTEVKEQFMKGYYRGDGDKTSISPRMDCKGKIGSAGLYHLLSDLGYNVSINTRNDKPSIYRLNALDKSKPQRKNATAVKKLDKLPPTNQFVYDLETENHHFSAGVGKMIVHNTDSVFVEFGYPSLAKCMALGKEASAHCTKVLFSKFGFFDTTAPTDRWVAKGVDMGIDDVYTDCYRTTDFITRPPFIAPISLEFEKCFFPYLLLSKKRYTGLFFTKLAMNLRCIDKCDINKSMKLSDAEKAQDAARLAGATHVTLDCPNPACKRHKKIGVNENIELSCKWDKLASTGIEIVRRDKCAIVRETMEICLKLILMKRDVEKAYDYAKMVISDVLEGKIDMSKLLLAQKYSKDASEYKNKQAHVELVGKMMKRNIHTAPKLGDRVPYVVKSGFMSHKKGASKYKDKAYQLSEDPLYMIENNISVDANYYIEKKLRNPLFSLFEPIMGDKRANELFTGDHTRKVKISSSNDGIGKFTVKIHRCLNCNAGVNDGAPLCNSCNTDEICATIYHKTLTTVDYFEKLHQRFMNHCQGCVQSKFNTINCTNRDCQLTYCKAHVSREMKLENKKLDRINKRNVMDW